MRAHNPTGERRHSVAVVPGDPGAHRRQRDGAVHRARVDEHVAERLRESARNGALAGPGRTIDRNDRTLTLGHRGFLLPYPCDGGSAPIPPPLPPHRFAMLRAGPRVASRWPVPTPASLRDAPGGAPGRLSMAVPPPHRFAMLRAGPRVASRWPVPPPHRFAMLRAGPPCLTRHRSERPAHGVSQ